MSADLDGLALRPPLEPMEATPVEKAPGGDGAWLYEPKWDGFRCLVFRSGAEIYLQSKAGDPFARYFPEVVAQFDRLTPARFVLDGELVIRHGDALDFDRLLLRIHPAPSRVRLLARESPATFIAFDLLVDADGASLVSRPLRERRAALERFAARAFDGVERLRLSPATAERAVAEGWLRHTGGAIDGIVAKRVDAPYRFGERDAVVKVKPKRTADCVVGGFRYAAKSHTVGSLLLGLYDDAGRLNHVGFASAFSGAQREELLAKVEPLIEPPGFTGRAPGGPSRWSRGRNTEWQPLRPKLVLEVAFDHVTSGRFRHGVQPIRWRPDKAPRQCTMEQLHQPVGEGLSALLDATHRAHA